MVVENYCQKDWKSISDFKTEMDGTVLPCPICGRIPVPMVRADSLDGYFACVSCFGGGGTSHAHIKTTDEKSYQNALYRAVELWNQGNNIDYYERLKNVFRSCYTCLNYDRKKGEKEGICRLGKLERPVFGCKDNYNRMSEKQFYSILTR